MYEKLNQVGGINKFDHENYSFLKMGIIKMKNLYTKIFVLKKYMEKTKEIPWNMKHQFHEANPKIPRIKTS